MERTPKEETSIVPMGIPMMPIEELKKLTAYVNDVKKTLMQKDKDYVIDRGKQYTVRSGYAKLHQGFFLSDGIADVRKISQDKPTEYVFTHYINKIEIKETILTTVYGFEAYVTVINVSTGRHASGEGACTVDELHMTHNMTPKWYHRCLATAKTRAWNRAVSNYVGSADVSAEEMGLVYEDEGTEPKHVESEQRNKGIDLPEDFNIPEWDFAERVGQQSWNDVESVVKEWIRDSGLSPVDTFEEPESDAMRAWLRPKAFLGDSFGRVAKMLDGAGFKWRPKEKRFVLMKPEGS